MNNEIRTITISTYNAKLGATIPNLNLPAITTCRANAPCRKGCYACKGTFLYSNVQKSMQKNLDIYLESPQAYFSQIQAYLTLRPYKFFRYHSSGDIVDMQYLDLMCDTARKCKQTKFLCYTKKFELVNEYLKARHKIPKNLTIVFSTWGFFIPENHYKLPMTWVKFDENKKNEKVLARANEKIPKNAFECTGHCETCQMCWNLKRKQNVYFHKH